VRGGAGQSARLGGHGLTRTRELAALCAVRAAAGYEEIEAMYIDHIKAIRANEAYRNCLLSVAIEMNSSQIEPRRMADKIMAAVGKEHIQFVCSQKTSAIGVWTGNREKEDYAKTMLDLLAHNHLYFAADIHAVSKTWKAHKLKLIDQMNKFRKVERMPKDPAWGARQVAFSGKAHGQADDCVLALQITLSNHRKQRINPNFIRMCNIDGRRF
jgi:hypothetical protein